jgi:EF hand
VQQNQGDDEDTGMGRGMMRHCMRQCMAEDGRMGEGWRKHGMMRHGGMMGPAAMRIIFALMDRDSDGTVSLEEFQAAHERIFKAMDTDKDGTLTPEEIHKGKSARNIRQASKFFEIKTGARPVPDSPSFFYV